MDSLTQIVLGASVGELVLGKKVGNKAMLYGAIAGTIPDLDVFASYFTHISRALEIHRGFTHSILFSLMFAPIFAWLVTRYEKLKDVKAWSLLFFWAFVTHPILDAHTTWGTQLFWPFDLRLAFKTIFVIDPLYTLPFLVCLIMAMCLRRDSAKRHKYNKLGLIISSSYLALSFLLKWMAYQQFEQALKQNQIEYTQLDTRPSPMNTILWSANVDTKDAYLLANYSFFDSQEIAFTPYPKNHYLLGNLKDNEQVKRMIAIAKGWYVIQKEEDKMYFCDLRFGLLSMAPNAKNFVFKYEISPQQDGSVKFVEVPKDSRNGKEMLLSLWKRLQGN